MDTFIAREHESEITFKISATALASLLFEWSVVIYSVVAVRVGETALESVPGTEHTGDR